MDIKNPTLKSFIIFIEAWILLIICKTFEKDRLILLFCGQMQMNLRANTIFSYSNRTQMRHADLKLVYVQYELLLDDKFWAILIRMSWEYNPSYCSHVVYWLNPKLTLRWRENTYSNGRSAPRWSGRPSWPIWEAR